MGNSQPKKSTENPQLPRQRVLHGDGRRTCVVLGATGATGKELVYQLCQSKEWGRITIIHRRELDLKTFHTGLDRGLTELSEDEKNKVVQHVVNLDELKSEANIKLFANHDICFCMLGTKRAVAGSAEKFKKVDLIYVQDGAYAARQAGVKQFSLCSSAGANANLWANDWKITHGLLYLQTKGLAEQYVLNQGFNRVSIFRPGAFSKPGPEPTALKLGIMTTTKVCDLAKVFIMDAESTDVPDYPQNEKENENKDDNENDKEKEKENDKEADTKDGKKDDEKDDEKKVDTEKKDEKAKKEEKKEAKAQESKEVIFYEKQLIDDLTFLDLYPSEKKDETKENDKKDDVKDSKDDKDGNESKNEKDLNDKSDAKDGKDGKEPANDAPASASGGDDAPKQNENNDKADAVGDAPADAPADAQEQEPAQGDAANDGGGSNDER